MSAVVEELLGALVVVRRTDTKDVYYGDLNAYDEHYLMLTDWVRGVHGDSGWWSHGSGKSIIISHGVVADLRQAKNKP